MIELKNISKSFTQGESSIPVLKNLELSLQRESSYAILGQSGSGKSTLLSLLAGLDRPEEGELIIESKKDIFKMDRDELANYRNQTISIVFQQFHLLGHLTTLENVMLPLQLRQDLQAKEKAQYWLGEVGLSHRLSHYPTQLSGGECQRVALARALSTEPNLILADEPTGNLDPETALKIEELLLSSVKKQKSILLLVTHNEKFASKCDFIYKLQQGKLVLCTA